MTAARQRDRLIHDVKTVIRDAEDLLRVTGSELGEKAAEERKRLSGALESARETCRRAEDQIEKCARETERMVREHPYETLGITFAAGILAAVLLFRK